MDGWWSTVGVVRIAWLPAFENRNMTDCDWQILLTKDVVSHSRSYSRNHIHFVCVGIQHWPFEDDLSIKCCYFSGNFRWEWNITNLAAKASACFLLPLRHICRKATSVRWSQAICGVWSSKESKALRVWWKGILTTIPAIGTCTPTPCPTKAYKFQYKRLCHGPRSAEFFVVGHFVPNETSVFVDGP